MSSATYPRGEKLHWILVKNWQFDGWTCFYPFSELMQKSLNIKFVDKLLQRWVPKKLVSETFVTGASSKTKTWQNSFPSYWKLFRPDFPAAFQFFCQTWGKNFPLIWNFGQDVNGFFAQTSNLLSLVVVVVAFVLVAALVLVAVVVAVVAVGGCAIYFLSFKVKAV